MTGLVQIHPMFHHYIKKRPPNQAALIIQMCQEAGISFPNELVMPNEFPLLCASGVTIMGANNPKHQRKIDLLDSARRCPGYVMNCSCIQPLKSSYN
jgi:hypothetical protein